MKIIHQLPYMVFPFESQALRTTHVVPVASDGLILSEQGSGQLSGALAGANPSVSYRACTALFGSPSRCTQYMLHIAVTWSSAASSYRDESRLLDPTGNSCNSPLPHDKRGWNRQGADPRLVPLHGLLMNFQTILGDNLVSKAKLAVCQAVQGDSSSVQCGLFCVLCCHTQQTHSWCFCYLEETLNYCHHGNLFLTYAPMQFT